MSFPVYGSSRQQMVGIDVRVFLPKLWRAKRSHGSSSHPIQYGMLRVVGVDSAPSTIGSV